MEKLEIIKEIIKFMEGRNTRQFADFTDDQLKGIYVILRVLKKEETSLTAGEISKKLYVSTARIAVALTQLEKKGLIVKSKDKIDGRKTIVTITPLGLETLEKRDQQIYSIIMKMFDKLSLEECEQLKDILLKLFSA